MTAYGMIYASAVGLPILLAAIACSAALRRYGKPERGVWLVGLGLALLLPVAFLISPFGGQDGLATVASGTQSETGVLGLPSVVTISVESSALGLDQVLVLAWLLASVVLTLRWAVAALRLARVGSSWSKAIVDGVHVWLTSDLGPAVSGILRTRILVPSWLESLPEDQRSLVLLHEQEHIRARDPVLLAFSRIARIIAPWNPVVWRLSSRLLNAVELDCDRRVLRRRPDIGTYGDTLLTVSARDSGPLVAAAAFAEVPLHKRIVAMTTPPRAVSFLGVLTALTLGTVLLIGSCEVPVPRVLEQEGQDDIVHVLIERDGSVYVEDQPYPMPAVSAVLAPRYDGSGPGPVVSIRGDHEVPYQVMDQLQQELVAAGAVRVVLETVDSQTLRPTPIDMRALVDQGLAVARDAVRAVYEALGSLAVRPPPDDVPALMERGLGIVLPAQIPEDVTISIRNILHLTVQPSGIVEVRRGASTMSENVHPREVESIWLQDVAYNPNLIAAVKTHPDTPYRYMMEVFGALHAAGTERISLQMLEN